MNARDALRQLRDITARAHRVIGRAEHVLEHAAEVRRRDDALSARITSPQGVASESRSATANDSLVATDAPCGGAPESVEDLAIALFELVEDQDGVRGASASFAWDEDEWVVTLRVAVEAGR